MAQIQQGDMIDLLPVYPSKVEEIGITDRIKSICGPKVMTELAKKQIKEKLKHDLCLPLDEAEMATLLEKDSDASSEKSESEIPYVDFEDFEREVASKLRFNKVWNKQEKYFQWNMLVIDKAKEAIYGVEQSIVRKVQSWERKEE